MQTWRVFDPVIGRVPLLPETVVPHGVYERTLAVHRQYRQHREAVGAEGRRLSREIERFVPLAPPADRQILLDLRRALFGGRDPARAWRSAVSRASSELTAPIEQWLRDLHVGGRLREDRERAFAEESALAHARLLAAYADDQPLRAAVALAHPTLVKKIQRCRALRCSDRQSDRTIDVLWRFLWRAAYRATPFGLFASWTLPAAWTHGRTSATIAGRQLFVSARPDLLRATLSGEPMIAAFRAGDLVLTGGLAAESAAAQQLVDTDDGRIEPRRLDAEAVRLMAVMETAPSQRMAVGDLMQRGFHRAVLVRACAQGWCRWGIDGDGQDGREPSMDAVRRRLWQEALLNPTALSAVVAVEPAAQASAWVLSQADTNDPEAVAALSIDSILSGDTPPLEPVCRDIATYGSALRLPRPALERRAFRRLLDEVNPQLGTAMPFVEFLSSAGDWLAANGHSRALLREPLALADLMGMSEPAVEQIANRLIDHWQGSADEAIVAPWLAPLLVPGGTRRAVYRAAPLSGNREAKALITLWGSDRMSLMPRVGRFAPELLAAHRRWMANWPHAVDMHTGRVGVGDTRESTTKRVLAGPSAPRRQSDLRLWDLEVRATDGGACGLYARDGSIVDPVFFGLTHSGAQPTWLLVALSLGGDAWSGIDLAYAALSRAVASIVGGAVSEMPGVWVTPHVQLAPRGWLIDARALPPAQNLPAPALLLAFRDWADAWGLPEGVCAVSEAGAMGDAAIVDLTVPSGIALLYRMAASRALLFIRSLAERPGGCGTLCFSKEHYVELSANA